jgi:adenine phosphoribosyltransferase
VTVDLRSFVREIPDFPKPGILFRDITPLLQNAAAFREAIDRLAEPYLNAGVGAIAAAEARGFLFAAPLALRLNASLVPIRKPGKLPFDKRSFHYDLEYGRDTLEIHVDGVRPGEKVLIVDDLLATGGTMEACCRLLESCDAEIIGCAFLIHLVMLGGAERLTPYPIHAVLPYDIDDEESELSIQNRVPGPNV